MIRRVYHILMSVILLTSTVGISVSKHYCGGILQNVSINSKADTCGDEMPMPMGCCNDEIHYYSLDIPFQQEQFTFDFVLPSIDQLFISFIIVPEPVEESFKGQEYFDFHSPPDQSGLYKLTHSFLI